MKEDKEVLFEIPNENELGTWFIRNVLTVHDSISCVRFFAFFIALHFVGKCIIGVTQRLWTWIIVCLVVFLYFVPAENVASFENLVESFKNFCDARPC